VCPYVCSSRPVAAFATSILGRLLTGGDTREMRIFVKLQPYVGMAGFAGSASYIVILGLILSRCGQRQDKYEYVSRPIPVTGAYEHK
jgi:hypothetical protein